MVRNFTGSETIFAPKSIFTVFRVPLIEVVCAGAVEILKPKLPGAGAASGNFSAWNILLYTIAFKSLFQMFEFVFSAIYSSTPYANFFFYATLVVVFSGIALMISRRREVLNDFRRREWQLTVARKLSLLILLTTYLALAFGPVFIYKSA